MARDACCRQHCHQWRPRRPGQPGSHLAAGWRHWQPLPGPAWAHRPPARWGRHVQLRSCTSGMPLFIFKEMLASTAERGFATPGPHESWHAQAMVSLATCDLAARGDCAAALAQLQRARCPALACVLHAGGVLKARSCTPAGQQRPRAQALVWYQAVHAAHKQ